LLKRKTKHGFFTTGNNFYLNPPICNLWSGGRTADVKPQRLLVKREKFSPRVMVSAGVCVDGKGHLYFVDEILSVAGKTVAKQWWKIVNSCYRMASYSRKTALRLTRHALDRNG